MLLDIIAVKYISDYRLVVTFENGEKKEVDLKDRLEGPVFEPLKDREFFKKVYIDQELGTIVWPNGADKAPETLYRIGKTVEDCQITED